ncbi:DUF4139 domain-containing protein [Saccharicrinis fermentans]|uniref:Mucoidy inhibitor MuiA family protein n=1 Tax=Saccharicrinis fermentans DSM 9555 = JCM 21142 TaxID=869213 RepID=W7YAI6_9BACT|nr:DUF4139 domain-containing protein [Saccharicrinis fermentans]GAF05367.1 hypothetical protein JCM21142_104099 [Saccharicrinis fermentans DSM 9555 = JCM 21142]
MKAINILLLILIFSNVFSQEILEKEIKTEVTEVTVFLNGAQIVRKKGVDLTKGKSIIKFVNLSPFIDAKSVQVKAEGELTVLSVNHQQNYLDKMEKSIELTDLEKQLETIEDKIKLENTYLSIIKEELTFLQKNQYIGGKNEQVSVTNLQQASDFYSKKLTSLKMKEIERNKTLKSLNTQKNDLQNQIKTLTSKKEYPSGEILVKVDAKQTNKFSLELTYLVKNAGWFPSYDIRAKNVNEPVQLIYKANVKQDTKVDWSNVKLKFSSADPNISSIAPELQTYFLNYNTLPPSYKLTENNVRGKVVDSNGEPLPGASVLVQGTTIGTVADLEGNYSITIPNNSSLLTYAHIGFYSKTLPITNSVMNIALEENEIDIQEVVVTAYGSEKKASKALRGSVAGIDIDKSIKIRGTNSLAIPTAQVENQTTVDFEINTPYTIKSDNKNYTVDMEVYDLPAFYQYYCVPKVNKDAFLIANIIDWEKYNLLEGEANVFFEDTYVGKTLLDVRYASDTLEISLGRDKKVSVNREKIKNFTNKQFIGNKKEETRAWKTTVKNNKSQAINMIILDQVPVSTIEEIEVNIQNISGAKQNSETGEIKWEFELKPNDKKDFELRYSVKHPKYRNLIVE